MNILHLFAQGSDAASTCTLNDKPIDCGELADKAAPFLGLGIGLLVILLVLAVVTFVFWLMMLLHAIKHNSPDRTTWIAILVISFLIGFPLIGAVVYYFAEKKKAEQFIEPTVNPGSSTPPTVEPTEK